MATVTPNFNWPVPTSTDLVKDGATAIEALGDSIDASLLDLKGGTTGQVLSKTTNTDMDFTWVTTDDANAIQNSIVDAKGDLISASANDTPARLAVGNNGETLVADSSTSTGLRYTAGTVQANPILNSAFDIWQRGTSQSFAASSYNVYSADRWALGVGANQAMTISRQATGDTTNLPSIQYCLRFQRNSGQTGTSPVSTFQNIETTNSIPYAGKTVTISFYARKGANYSGGSDVLQAILYSGTGTDQSIYSGFTGVATVTSQNATLTSTWQRFSYTATVAATATQLALGFQYTPSGTAGAADYFEATGVQIDIGSTALPFRRNGATIQGELAACQRYYYRQTAPGTYTVFATGGSTGSTNARFVISYPVQMRVAPTSLDYSTLAVAEAGGSVIAATSAALDGVLAVLITVSSGLTQYRSNFLYSNNSTSAYIGFSAEL
jgi:hypothetical protein